MKRHHEAAFPFAMSSPTVDRDTSLRKETLEHNQSSLSCAHGVKGDLRLQFCSQNGSALAPERLQHVPVETCPISMALQLLADCLWLNAADFT